MSHVFHRSPSKTYPEAVRAEGAWIWDAGGRRYLDGSGGACVVTIGHGVPEIRQAADAQMDALSFAHGSHFTTRACEELAQRVAALSPDPELDRVYFVSGGSEAVETAVKLARQYWREMGRPDRYKVVSRWTSYHGNTAGALALGGHTGRRSPYLPLIQHTPHVEPCYCYRCPFGRESGPVVFLARKPWTGPSATRGPRASRPSSPSPSWGRPRACWSRRTGTGSGFVRSATATASS
ncbi:MAG: aminotransferase class III-fold pyridoxal phosphate-dependent enzyme [Deferrisomatales bacterium]|nr:aminotransferase class III-fold pyridoxal phosphate-dependent enzyme [Deferrisomatales bacterium]